MKKAICSVLLLTFMLLPLAAAHADIIFVPKDNFLDRNSRDCVYVGRNFTVDAETGVAVYWEPGSTDIVGTVEPGQQLHVYYTYEKAGTHWGMVWDSAFAGEREPVAAPEPTDPDEPTEAEAAFDDTGWLDMAHMLLVYDEQSFTEEYADRIVADQGDWSELSGVQSIALWPYPGAPEPLATTQSGTQYFATGIERRFVDDDGLRWAYGYKLDGYNAWVCLSDPNGTGLGELRPVPHTGNWEPPAPRGGPSILTLAVLLVAAVVAGTALLIRVLYRPNL